MLASALIYAGEVVSNDALSAVTEAHAHSTDFCVGKRAPLARDGWRQGLHVGVGRGLGPYLQNAAYAVVQRI